MQVVNKTLVKIHNKRTGFLCDITKNEGNKTVPFLKILYIMRVKQRKRFLKNIVKTSCRRAKGTAAGGFSGLLSQKDQPLTEPAVTPLMMDLERMMYTISTGRMASRMNM